jgi:hypothetical protein
MCRRLYNDTAHHFIATTSHVFSILSLIWGLRVIFMASGKIPMENICFPVSALGFLLSHMP